MIIKNLVNHFKHIAVLEAIVSPEWEYRYFSYNGKWDDKSEMASMKDGEGVKWFLWFDSEKAGWVFIDFEQPPIMDLAETKQQFPNGYEIFLNEPTLTIGNARVLGYLQNEEWFYFGNRDFDSAKEAIKSFNWLPKDYKT